MEEGMSGQSSGSVHLSNQGQGGKSLGNKAKEYLKRRDATKICLYEQFTRWRELKEQLQVKTDKEVAAFLLDKHYNSSPKKYTRYLILIGLWSM
jgi:hypothetical protein